MEKFTVDILGFQYDEWAENEEQAKQQAFDEALSNLWDTFGGENK